MKTLLILAIACSLLCACNTSQPESKTIHSEGAQTDTIRLKEAYACPMHPDITSDAPGSCSICGMALEKL